MGVGSETEFLAGDEAAAAIYSAVKAVIAALGPCDTRVSGSQIGFYRAHPFASVWRPNRYLSGNRPPLVLSVYLRRPRRSSRWREVVEPRPGRFTHHAELRSVADVDEEVRRALAKAWKEAKNVCASGRERSR